MASPGSVSAAQERKSLFRLVLPGSWYRETTFPLFEASSPSSCKQATKTESQPEGLFVLKRIVDPTFRKNPNLSEIRLGVFAQKKRQDKFLETQASKDVANIRRNFMSAGEAGLIIFTLQTSFPQSIHPFCSSLVLGH